MIKLIHCITGVEMWVHESQLDSFLERGHKQAPLPKKEKKAPVKRRRKKDGGVCDDK